MASEKGHAKVGEMLITNGARVNDEDNLGRSPLHEGQIKVMLKSSRCFFLTVLS